MTPAARLQAAIEILEALEKTNQAADRLLRDWFRGRRYAGAKDRAAIRERVFAVLRHRASLGWRMGSEHPRALVIASLLDEGHDLGALENLFAGGNYGPAPLDEAERAAIAREDSEPAPFWVRCEFPAFLETELLRSFRRDAARREMRAMQERAPVDLRVNTLRATRDRLLDYLNMTGFDVEPTPVSPYGVRVVGREKASELRNVRAFLEGRFEFQDEGAQIASILCAAKPGMRILDLAAGAGGKALALAAEMKNNGVIVARDSDAARLAQLAPRAARAKVTIIRIQGQEIASPGAQGQEIVSREPAPDKTPVQSQDTISGPETFDAVFVDAPCSGSGAWRRQPEQKWRLTPERLRELEGVQDALLDEAAAATHGRIVYATCSILKCENEDRIEAFLARRPDFHVVPAADIWRERTGAAPPRGMDTFFKATPRTTGTDGFFTAVLTRSM